MEVAAVPQIIDLQVNEFKSWLENETVNVLKPLKDAGRKLLEKVKDRVEDFRENVERLAEEGARELERGKAVRKARVTEKLCRYFMKQIDKISFPDEISFTILEALHKDLEKTLSLIGRERGAWFPRISPLFIIARRRVDFAFSRLGGSISELGAFVSGECERMKVAEELFFEIDELARILNDIGRFEGRKASIKEKAQNSQDMIEKDRQMIESLKESAKLGDLADINQKVQQLKQQVQYEFRHLEKPFMKFANLTGGPGYALSSEEVAKFERYLNNSFTALATEKNGYPLLKSILKKVEVAMNAGKLKLKSSRLRKAQEKIDEIVNKNAFDDLHLVCSRVFSSSQSLVSSEETRGAKKKLRQLEQRLEMMQKRKKAAAIRMDALEKEHKQLLSRVGEKKKHLEDSVFDILDKRVILKF